MENNVIKKDKEFAASILAKIFSWFFWYLLAMLANNVWPNNWTYFIKKACLLCLMFLSFFFVLSLYFLNKDIAKAKKAKSEEKA